MAEYTPTTTEVREVVMGAADRWAMTHRERGEALDRFLAAHEHELRERIAQDIEAAAEFEIRYTLGGNSGPTDAQQKRADLIDWFSKTTADIARGATR